MRQLLGSSGALACWLFAVGCAPADPAATVPHPTDGDADTDTDADADTDADTEPAAPPPVCINELMPDNQGALRDPTGATPDWIELHAPGAADVSLDGWTVSDNPANPTQHGLLPGLVVPAGGYLLLYADGFPELGPTHLNFSLSGTGESVGIYPPDGAGSVVNFTAVSPDVAVARASDCCVGAGCWTYPWRGTPGATNAVPATVLLRMGSAWRYWDLATPPADTWFSAAFADAAWAEGPAPLGYGDAPATTLDAGTDPANKRPTAWFRGHFEVADPAALGLLRLRVHRDDGIALYVNGIAILRNNLDHVAADALADAPIEGAAESEWLEIPVDPMVLVAGTNVIAAEVHQAARDSDDLAFDAELLAP